MISHCLLYYLNRSHQIIADDCYSTTLLLPAWNRLSNEVNKAKIADLKIPDAIRHYQPRFFNRSGYAVDYSKSSFCDSIKVLSL